MYVDKIERTGRRPLRIAIATDTYEPQTNGVSRTLGMATRALIERGHDVRVFTPDDPNAVPDPRIVPFRSRPFWAYPQLRLTAPMTGQMVAAMTKWRPDLIHVATPFGVGLSALWTSQRLKIPLISSYHTSLAAYARFYNLGALSGIGWKYLRWFHNQSARTMVPTMTIRKELTEQGFSNLSIWGRGIDASAFNPTWRSEVRRASWGASSSTLVVAYVGRLAQEKGVTIALAAMREIANEKHDTAFVFAGDGAFEVECRRLAPAGTTFTGRISGRELSETYASADAFVFPSTTDTFGNVLQEAMASRLAVVAADVPQTREVVGRAGLLIAPEDSSAMATALRSMLASPALVEQLRNNALESVAGRTWDATFDQLERAYAEAVGLVGDERRAKAGMGA
jgi:phosphatidylinositol alpha 1,6-mannosyltransferase